jgi:hypothetical protein
MQVGEPLNGISKGLFVNFGIFRADSVADSAIGDSGKL